MEDAHGKLKALADLAEEFGDRFVRMEAISKNEKGDLGAGSRGTLRMLDLTEAGVRQTIRTSASAADAYRQAGQEYVSSVGEAG